MKIHFIKRLHQFTSTWIDRSTSELEPVLLRISSRSLAWFVQELLNRDHFLYDADRRP